MLRDPQRLLTSQKRRADGSYEPVALAEAIRDIAARLTELKDRWGPDSIAFYPGTMTTTNSTTRVLFDALRTAVGSRMRFSPNTIDKAGKQVAEALHGRWMVPVSGYDEPEAAVLIGINPPIAYQGAPRGNPSAWLRRQTERGMQLVVIDPRHTEAARLSTLYLQPLPGHDAALLAAMLRVVITEELYDREFVAEHVDGLDDLRRAVDRFTPESVARDADIDAGDLVTAARIIGAARRGYVSVGTGPNMAGPGTLVEYLALCLDTLGGHVAHEGDVVRNAASLLPTPVYRAQMSAPRPAVNVGPVLDRSGLTTSVAGPPVAGLPAEMSRRDGRQVRALISCGGNPASAWPGQRAVVDALRGLELLIQVDPWMSNTSRLADYVIAPTMALEVADMTQHLDGMTQLSIGYGLVDSYAQHTAAVADPPPGSEVVEEWKFFFGLAREMGLELQLPRAGRAAVTARHGCPAADHRRAAGPACRRLPRPTRRRQGSRRRCAVPGPGSPCPAARTGLDRPGRRRQRNHADRAGRDPDHGACA